LIDAPCGGNGTCGKCNVLLDQDGVETRVLACKTLISQDCSVTLPKTAQLDTLREGAQRVVEFAPCSSVGEPVDGACFAAIDLGTTSIVCYLLDGRTGEEIVSRGMQNAVRVRRGCDQPRKLCLTSNEPDVLRELRHRAFQTLIEQTTKEAGRHAGASDVVSIVATR
jgi:uncharacterized 2Fe-2S/4Fe-4S cluster protein (DUF4445 family)